MEIHSQVINKLNSGHYDRLLNELSNIGFKISSTELIDCLYKQHLKGIKVYGQSLKDCPQNAYNWDLMASEELADLLCYIIKKNTK